MTEWMMAMAISVRSWLPCFETVDEEPLALAAEEQANLVESDTDYEDDIPMAFIVPGKTVRREDSYFGLWYRKRLEHQQQTAQAQEDET